jgi:Domain of unknown function (DUF2019)
MKRVNLQRMNDDELVKHFTSLALEQDEALLDSDISKVSRLYWRLKSVEAELKGREGDQRRALLKLYDYPNAQVRLKATKATLAVAPEAATRMLETIPGSREFPQAGEAGMSIYNLDAGIFKPT